jgi:hypothetical protein
MRTLGRRMPQDERPTASRRMTSTGIPLAAEVHMLLHDALSCINIHHTWISKKEQVAG